MNRSLSPRAQLPALFLLFFVFFFALSASHASAHEVYVLSPQAIHADITNPSPDPLLLVGSDTDEFAIWAFMGALLVGAILLISISRKIEKLCDPFLFKLKKWAPLVARLTLGGSLLASGIYNALFGPELPLDTLFGPWGIYVRAILILGGICIVLGLFVRTWASVMLVVYIVAASLLDNYILTYLNYFGEIVLSIVLGVGALSLDRAIFKPKNRGWVHAFAQRFERYSFAVNRVCFGVAALWASWYAKLIHSNLALDTVNQYHLTNYFHFTPLFLVLGALLVESAIGIFFILGFEVRFTALVFLVFLTLSLSFFGEAVWPHLILLGLCLTMIMHGYDKYSIEGRFVKNGREPVL